MVHVEESKGRTNPILEDDEESINGACEELPSTYMGARPLITSFLINAAIDESNS
jgi:hypothetical protein